MPSPFPGMNPYFEQTDFWHDFQGEFLVTLRHQLAPQIAPKYIIQLREHIYIHDVPPAEAGFLTKVAEKVRFLEIRECEGRELIAVIELLSPFNKQPGRDREQYLAERRDLLMSPAHLVEIDLLRGWGPMPLDNRPDCDYSVFVSRAERRPTAEMWPIRLRDRLPVIPIPLRAPDTDCKVDLQEVLHRAYEGAGYERFIYGGTPEPPLAPDDAAWAQQFVPARP
jgi:hypothetical protein